MPNRNVPRPGWRKWLPREPKHLGRRGAILLLFGLCWVMLGIGIVMSPPEPGSPFLHEQLDPTLLASLWIGTGLIAIGFAWRPPGRHDAFGFTALYVMPAMRVTSYALAYIDSIIPIGGDGSPAAWRGTAVWLIIVAAVMVCAGWPEPPHAAALKPADRDRTDLPAGD